MPQEMRIKPSERCRGCCNSIHPEGCTFTARHVFPPSPTIATLTAPLDGWINVCLLGASLASADGGVMVVQLDSSMMTRMDTGSEGYVRQPPTLNASAPFGDIASIWASSRQYFCSGPFISDDFYLLGVNGTIPDFGSTFPRLAFVLILIRRHLRGLGQLECVVWTH
ncbi:hypothetical protein EDB83DRAFT_1358967 [Lactarius deliciosus]|nr:hypothetical protein EDB83DRAFT_1358967 [Lactarius deliciosus]